ncbi:MAG: hypothetical protein NWE93_08155 [Candidatus Bathyarchaeota archaeon]|nr:hypothetical protein [Candidatus Bathyarchaeota archaeon]
MNAKRSLQTRIRGWFPQEHASPSNRKIEAAPMSRIGAISARTFGGLGVASLLAGFVLLAAPYLLFPNSFTPKANSGWGYASPRTPEAWIILAGAIALIFISVLAFTFCGVKLKTQGSKWMKYTRWVTPAEDFGDLFKATVAANIMLVCAFLGFTLYTAATAGSQPLFTSVIIFTVLIALVNLFFHEYGKKKTAEKKETSK